MNKRDRIKLYILLIWWIALNVWVWGLQHTPFDWVRAGSSIGTLVVIALLAWIWHKRYLTEQKRTSREQQCEEQ